jgi:hypothetical protein
MDKRIEQWHRRAERLEKKASSHFSPGADGWSQAVKLEDVDPDNR